MSEIRAMGSEVSSQFIVGSLLIISRWFCQDRSHPLFVFEGTKMGEIPRTRVKVWFNGLSLARV